MGYLGVLGTHVWSSGEPWLLVGPEKAPACIQEHEVEQTIRSERLLMTQPRRLRQEIASPEHNTRASAEKG